MPHRALLVSPVVAKVPPAAPTTPGPDLDLKERKDAFAGATRWQARVPTLRTFLMVGGILAVLAVSGLFWLRGGRYASTDDAYVQAAKLLVSTDVSGLVASVDVHEGQAVRAGQLLFRVDPRQFQIALDNAQANLAETALTIESMKQDYKRMLSDVATQQAKVELDQVTFDRDAALVGNNDISRANYDRARFTLAADTSALESLRQQAQVQLAKLAGNPDIPVAEHPQYRQAKAQVDEAQRQLDHTQVRAPFDGVVTEVDALQSGTYLVSQTAALTNTGALALVSTDRLWVEANLKETDLTYVKPGNDVNVWVDTYPGRSWSGTVESIGPASGSEFSILPAQNTSGNWVKVVQRIPVRVRVEPQVRRPAVARRHERDRRYRYRSSPLVVGSILNSRKLIAMSSTSSDELSGVPHRALITVCAMGATLMQALDTTIANVALPYIQGSLAATSDEITWVLTSYIVAAAIMTAPVGWLSARIGRKYLFLISLAGFTIASMLCGIADSLAQMVLFRLLQGAFGAALVPLSQATMLDLYPIEQRGSAMALWGVGVMVGPILGPTLGGYLTDIYDWRWVFYINVPFGLLAIAGLWLFMKRTSGNPGLRFDGVGFAVLGLGLGALQLMLDRGEQKDWFGSTEIVAYAVLSGLGFYLFVVHMFTARKPLIAPRMFRDVNFATGLLMMFAVGLVLLASTALLAPYLQTLGGYSVSQAGLLMAPRGAGTMAAMVLGGRLSNRIDPRVLMLVGISLMAGAMWEMLRWTPDIDAWSFSVNSLILGFGLGLVFTPLQVAAFSTLPAELRTDGTALFSLVRNVGSAIGISSTSALLAHNTQLMHAQIAEHVHPFNRMLQTGAAYLFWNTATPNGLAAINEEVTRQASIIAYVDDFKLLFLVCLPMALLVPFMRRPQFRPGADDHGPVLH